MQAQAGAHRPIAGVVVPAVVVGKGGGRLAVIGGRFTLAAKHPQTATVIGAELSERHLNAETAAASELICVALGPGLIARLERSLTEALRRVETGAVAA